MALNLDARQRAMLHEMGITVWAPAPAQALAQPPEQSPRAPVAAPLAPPLAAPVVSPVPTREPRQAPAVTAPAPAVQPPAVTSSSSSPQPSGYTLCTPRQAYPDAPLREGDAAWLVVVECAQENAPFSGEAGQLLDNMLRALQLQGNGRVFIAPLVRGSAAQACTVEDALAQVQPRLVLALGLAAARTLLPGQAPLGRLRASPQVVAGTPMVVSYDPAYLLRAPQAKAAAWADLCRAHTVATAPPRV